MGPLLALVATLLFGCAGLITRAAIQTVERRQGLIIAMTANAVILNAAAVVWILLGHAGSIRISAVVFFVAGGVSGTLIGRWALFAAIQDLGPSRAALYKNMQPLITTAVAVPVLGETLRTGALIGGLAILTGIALTSIEPLAGQEKALWGIGTQRRRWGVAFGLVSAMGFSGGNLLRKVAIELWAQPVVGAAIGVTVAMVLSALLAKPGVVRQSFSERQRRGTLLYVVVGLVTGGAQVVFLASLIFTDVWIVSVIMASEPVLLVLISRTLLPGREHFTPWTLWGSILVVAGLSVMITW